MTVDSDGVVVRIATTLVDVDVDVNVDVNVGVDVGACLSAVLLFSSVIRKLSAPHFCKGWWRRPALLHMLATERVPNKGTSQVFPTSVQSVLSCLA